MRSSNCFVISVFLTVMPAFVSASDDAPPVAEDDGVAAFEQGKGLLEAGNVDEAIVYLQRGLQSKEKEVPAHANLARAYLKRGETEKADKEVREAQRIGVRRIRKAIADETISAQLFVDRGFAWIAHRRSPSWQS